MLLVYIRTKIYNKCGDSAFRYVKVQEENMCICVSLVRIASGATPTETLQERHMLEKLVLEHLSDRFTISQSQQKHSS